MYKRYTFLSFIVILTLFTGCELPFSQRLYKLSVSPDIRGGTISIPKNFALGGECITISIINDADFSVAESSLKYTVNGKSVFIEFDPGNKQPYFYMPAGDTELFVEFVDDRGVEISFPSEFYSFTGAIKLKPTISIDNIEQSDIDPGDFIWTVEDTENFSVSGNGIVTCSRPGLTTEVSVHTIDHSVNASCKVTCLPYNFLTSRDGTICEITGFASGTVLPNDASSTSYHISADDPFSNFDDYTPPDSDWKPVAPGSLTRYDFYIPDAIDGLDVVGIAESDWADGMLGTERVTVMRLPASCRKLASECFRAFTSLKIFYAESLEPPVVENSGSSASANPLFATDTIDIIYVNYEKTSINSPDRNKPNYYVKKYNDAAVWGDYYKANIIEKGQYRIRIKPIANGDVQVWVGDGPSFGAESGESITLSPIGDGEGNYGFECDTITGKADSSIDVNFDDSWGFTMPDNNVTIGATFKLNSTIKVVNTRNFSYITTEPRNSNITLKIFPFPGHIVGKVEVARTDNTVTAPEQIPNNAYTPVDKDAGNLSDRYTAYTFESLNDSSGEPQETIWVKVTCSAKTYSAMLDLNHEPWKDPYIVNLGNLIFNNIPPQIIFSDAIPQRPNSILEGIYWTDDNGDKINYYSMGESNGQTTANGIRPWNIDADEGTEFTFTAAWSGNPSTITFDAGYFSDPDAGMLDKLSNLPATITERYGEPIKHELLPAMDCPGFDILGYADKPQESEDQVNAGIEPEGATFYYEPQKKNGVRTGYMIPVDKGSKDGDIAARGTNWDLMAPESGGTIKLYAIWSKAQWDGVSISEPRGPGKNMIYTPNELAYLTSAAAETKLNKRYYLMNDIDLSCNVQTGNLFYPIGSNLAVVTDTRNNPIALKKDNAGGVVSGNPIQTPFTGQLLPGRLNAQNLPEVDPTGYREIRNMTIDIPDDVSIDPNIINIGLFGEIGAGASVERIIITDTCHIKSASGTKYIGALAGQVSGGKIIDCINNAKVEETADTQEFGATVGGLIGAVAQKDTGDYTGPITIKKVGNNGTVIGSRTVGGLIGMLQTNADFTLTDSFNTGNISDTGGVQTATLGGLIGSVANLQRELTISKCYNLGTVTSNGISGTGGLVGLVVGSGAPYAVEVYNSYNAGMITASQTVGGFIGISERPTRIYNSYSMGHVSSSSQQNRSILLNARGSTPLFSNCVVAMNNVNNTDGLNTYEYSGTYSYVPLYNEGTHLTAVNAANPKEILAYKNGSGIRATETESFKPLGTGNDLQILNILNGGRNENGKIWKWGGGLDSNGLPSLKEVVYFGNRNTPGVQFKNTSRPVLATVGEGITALPDTENYIPRIERIEASGSTTNSTTVTVMELLDPDQIVTNATYTLTENIDLSGIDLSNDSSVTGSITIPSGKNITIDLHGFVIKGSGKGPVILNEGSVTIIDTAPSYKHKYHTNTQTKCYSWDLDMGDGDLEIPGGAITGGTDSSASGGGIYNTGTLRMTGGTIVGNYTEKFTAGIHNNKGVIELTGIKIMGNVSANELSSPGIFSTSAANSTEPIVRLTNVTINNNISLGRAALTIAYGTATITNSLITDNTCGGILVMSETKNTIITGGSIVRNGSSSNTADYGGGIVSIAKNAIIVIEGVLINNNVGTERNKGPGVFVMGGTTTIRSNPMDEPDATKRTFTRIENNTSANGLTGISAADSGTALIVEECAVLGSLTEENSGDLQIKGGYFNTVSSNYLMSLDYEQIDNPNDDSRFGAVYLFKVRKKPTTGE